MQIIFQSKFSLVIFIIMGLIFNLKSYASSEIIKDKKYGIFELKIKNDKIFLINNKNKISINPDADAGINNISSVRFFKNKLHNFKNINYLFILVSNPSRLNRRAGQCGAGEEKYFKIFKLHINSIASVSSHLISSCVYSYELINNEYEKKSIEIINDKAVIYWVSGPSHLENKNERGIIDIVTGNIKLESYE